MANIVASIGKTYALYRLITGLVIACVFLIFGSIFMAMNKPVELRDKKSGKITKVNSKLVGGGSWSSALLCALLGYLFYRFATSSNNAARLSALVGTANVASRMFRRR